MTVDMIPLAMGAVLVVAMVLEIKTGRIPNWLTLLPFLLFAALLVVSGDRTTLYWQMGLAVGVFVFGLVMFALGGSGAGAVKLMTGTALFVPLAKAGYAAIIFFLVFFISSFVFVQIRKAFGSENSSWHLMANAVLPLSFSIGVAGLTGMFWL
ncbi:type IV leader peptidase family protein [Yoonia maricola]|uniref:Type IV leader peptidase family protein n=1 Tax=Yoonia maricola TaxID=420999 RepID=A0A2M8WL64_9RHOB|nr:prepilin peptidase [Yoonia maricola]PJI91659.1 type IV leader peptidase family protein [Yoonia maricola]